MLVELDRRGLVRRHLRHHGRGSRHGGGVLGYLPDDRRLFRSLELAEEAGVEVGFAFTEVAESRHPNAVKFILTGRSGLMVDLVGDSTGGGMVETVMVDGFPYRTLGDAFVLLVQDPQEALSAEKLERLRAELPDVVDAQDVRVDGRGVLYAYALPVEPDLAALRELLDGDVPVLRLALLRPVLPVVSRPDRKPQLFDTMTRWRELAAEHDLPLWEVAVQYEMDASGLAAQRGRGPHAGAGAGHAAPDPRRVRGGRRRHRHRVQAGLRRPVDEARGDAGPRQRRRHGADHQVRVRRRRRHPRRRERARGLWAAGRATSTPPSAPCRRPAASATTTCSAGSSSPPVSARSPTRAPSPPAKC